MFLSHTSSSYNTPNCFFAKPDDTLGSINKPRGNASLFIRSTNPSNDLLDELNKIAFELKDESSYATEQVIKNALTDSNRMVRHRLATALCQFAAEQNSRVVDEKVIKILSAASIEPRLNLAYARRMFDNSTTDSHEGEARVIRGCDYLYDELCNSNSRSSIEEITKIIKSNFPKILNLAIYTTYTCSVHAVDLCGRFTKKNPTAVYKMLVAGDIESPNERAAKIRFLCQTMDRASDSLKVIRAIEDKLVTDLTSKKRGVASFAKDVLLSLKSNSVLADCNGVKAILRRLSKGTSQANREVLSFVLGDFRGESLKDLLTFCQDGKENKMIVVASALNALAIRTIQRMAVIQDNGRHCREVYLKTLESDSLVRSDRNFLLSNEVADFVAKLRANAPQRSGMQISAGWLQFALEQLERVR